MHVPAPPGLLYNSDMEIQNWSERSLQLIGREAFARLRCARVAVFGLGGVGSFAVEALARSGVGSLLLVDKDRVAASNINRQLPAEAGTIGRMKTEVIAEHIRKLGTGTEVETRAEQLHPGQAASFLTADLDFVLDCIDDVPAKADIARSCARTGLPLIIAGGCGRRLDPGRLCIRDLFKTEYDPLLKRLRAELRRDGLRNLSALCSAEPALPLPENAEGPSSMIFVPASAGLMMASEAVMRLCGLKPNPPVVSPLSLKKEKRAPQN